MIKLIPRQVVTSMKISSSSRRKIILTAGIRRCISRIKINFSTQKLDKLRFVSACRHFTFQTKVQKTTFILCICFCFCLCLFLNIAASGEDELVKLKNGKILLSKANVIGLDKVSRKRGKATMLVNASIDQVIDTILDHNHYAEFMPSVVECRIIEESEMTRVVAYCVKMGFMEVFCHLRWFFAPKNIHHDKIRIDCAIDNKFPANVADIQGTWILEPLIENTQTKVTYTVYMKSGKFIPGFIERYISRRQLPKIMKNIRNRVVSGGVWKKGDDK